MHVAAKHCSSKCVIALISRAANVDPLDNQLRTPLHLALETQSAQANTTAGYLIELGADIEAKDNFQRTPLMYACKVGNQTIVK